MAKKEYPNIPGYRIEKVLGEGGMGIVYLAIQIALDRKVALKVTLPALAEMDSSFTKRFVREAVATAALAHQNIITVYDAGVFENSSYMAMEYISSGTLADLDKSKLPHNEICQLFIGICQGLAAAHRAGFVHRDIKPDNILIDCAGLPIVTDFGIVKSLGEKNTAITIAGGTIGTPQYMSPEQIKAEDLDGRSDLYSVGVMLYKLLEGHAPFVDPTPSAVYIMHVTTEPPPLSGHSSVFQEIVSCLLQKNPNDRYKDAEALIVALKELKFKPTNGVEVSPKKPKPVKQAQINKDTTDKTKLVKSVSKSKNKNIQKAKTSNTSTVVNLAKTPPVTRKYVSPKDSQSQNNNKPLIVSVGAVLLLVIASYFAYTQKIQNQASENTQIAKEVKEIPLDEKDWSQAQKDSTQESYVKYLSSHPEGGFSSLAEQRLKTIRDKVKQDILDKEQQLTDLIEQQITQDKILQERQSTETSNEEQEDKPLITDLQQATDNLDSTKTDVVTENSTEPLVEKSIVIKDIKPVENNTNQDEEQIAGLLELAMSDLDSWNLMSPKNANAKARYNQVLTLDDQNVEARKGLLKIIYKYTILVNKKVSENKYSDASAFLNNAISIREEYLSSGYPKNEFHGVSQVISIPELRLLSKSIREKSIVYDKRQAQIIANRDVNNKDAFYNKGLSAYKAKDYTRAIELIEKAAKLGQIKAQLKLGDIYYAGEGVVQNDVKAFEWYRKSANNNNKAAQTYLGIMYQEGSGVGQSSSTAIEWYNRAASQNYAKAQYLLGHSYLKGAGVAQSGSEAFKWFSKAANQDYARAQYSLGKMYYGGKGLEKNHEMALSWFLKSGNQGLADAQDMLGLIFLKGHGVKKEYKESFKWYEKAALQDHVNALAQLGTMHEYGRGIKRRSEGKAIYWYKKAAKKGNKYAIKKLRQRGISIAEYN